MPHRGYHLVPWDPSAKMPSVSFLELSLQTTQALNSFQVPLPRYKEIKIWTSGNSLHFKFPNSYMDKPDYITYFFFLFNSCCLKPSQPQRVWPRRALTRCGAAWCSLDPSLRWHLQLCTLAKFTLTILDAISAKAVSQSGISVQKVVAKDWYRVHPQQCWQWVGVGLAISWK